ncbi:MAG: hypothetical protein HGA53_00620 [Anaerolineaceae bacterium]|nr:hypothetical protein [Anaerolineaceae bacterium]NTV35434.1 hypothetical protein [Anaerolineaceae bacterium]
MNRILVAYTTNSGSTEEVARAVAEELAKNGDTVNVQRLEEVHDLETYQAVVIGAPMILGWHPAAQKFVKKNRETLKNIRVAYFATAMSLTQLDENHTDGVSVYVDPYLALPPKRAGRLSIKENYATVTNYLRPILKAAPAVKPVSAAFFGGKLELFRLNFFQMIFVMVVIQAQPGDKRNWSAIQEWAGNLRTIFQETDRY